MARDVLGNSTPSSVAEEGVQDTHATHCGSIPIRRRDVDVGPLPHKFLHVGKGGRIVREGLEVHQGSIEVEEKGVGVGHITRVP